MFVDQFLQSEILLVAPALGRPRPNVLPGSNERPLIGIASSLPRDFREAPPIALQSGLLAAERLPALNAASKQTPSKKRAGHSKSKKLPKAKVTTKAKATAAKVKTTNVSKQSAKAIQTQGPRAGSKGASILALIARGNGAPLAEIIEATGWQPHSVRGFLATAAKSTTSNLSPPRTTRESESIGFRNSPSSLRFPAAGRFSPGGFHFHADISCSSRAQSQTRQAAFSTCL